LLLGLASRRFGEHLPEFVARYAGDTLWALLAFLAMSCLRPRASLGRRAAGALLFAYAIELSQLYRAPWIDAVRRTTLGGLVLGFGFLWSDLLCYAIGILFGAAIDFAVRRERRQDGSESRQDFR
jgi:hypothetical protein